MKIFKNSLFVYFSFMMKKREMRLIIKTEILKWEMKKHKERKRKWKERKKNEIRKLNIF